MTNQELLDAPKSTLHGLDKQRRYVLQIAVTPLPCPACLQPVSQADAVGGLEHYNVNGSDREFHCPHCRRELKLIVPFIGGPSAMFWQLTQPVEPQP